MTATGSTQILHRITEAVPTLRHNGSQAERAGWIPAQNIGLLDDAGVFRMPVPEPHGGLALSIADQTAVLAEIARGCGSTGWTALTWINNAWNATLFSAQAQQEVFAAGSVRVSGVFTPSGVAEPTDGGYLFTGQWRFNTGCRGADWNLVGAMCRPDGGEPYALFALIPMSAFDIADDWYVSAAAATGSASTSTKNHFVPQHLVVTADDLLGGGVADRLAADKGRDYRMVSLSVAEATAVYIGMARGALESFLERLPGRAIPYTAWTDQRQHPLTQRSVALATNKISAAEGLSAQVNDLLQLRADQNTAPTLDERARTRGQCATAVALVREAVQELQTIAGSSALSLTAGFQRFHRDLLGLATHALMAPDGGLEVHGRTIVGLDPGTPYL